MRRITLILLIWALFFQVEVPVQARSNPFLSIFSRHNKDISGVLEYVKKAQSYLNDSPNLIAAKENIDSAFSLCGRLRIEQPAELHLIRAKYFMLKKDYSGASQEAMTALEKARDQNQKKNEADILTFLGKYYLNTGFFNESINFFNESISVAHKEKLKGIIAGDYLGIAYVYNALKKLPEYQEFLKKSMNSAKSDKDTANLLMSYFRYGTSLTEIDKNFKKADSLLRKCVELSALKKDTLFFGLAWANLGWNFYVEQKYDSAITCYNRSLYYSLAEKRYSTSANSYGNLGTIYRDLGDRKKALYYYDNAISQANSGDDPYIMAWVYNDMSQMYLRNRDTANAYLSYVNYKKYSDIDLQRANMKGLDEASARYEADSHRKEVELLSLKLRNQRLLIYGSSGLFILTISVILLIFNRAKINAKRKISEMDHKISEVTLANLRQQMNPHFIFNTLNSIQYYMYQHDKLATNNYLTKFSSLMRKVLENSQHTAIPLRDELDALQLYLDLEKIRFKDKFNYFISIDDEIDPLMFKIPTMLIQPYVENSICHGLMPADHNGQIKIDVKLEKNYLACTIEDNGIGRQAAMEKKARQNGNHNSLGTQITSSRLDIVNALCGTCLKTIYSDLKDENGVPVGTKVEIHIPIMT
jgi:tetratricopeptide (TPR) repeat protein